MPYRHHIFICTNERPADDPRGSCAGAPLVDHFKAAFRRHGLPPEIVRANKAGCLDHCAHGATVVVYPDATWYGRVTPEDVDEIVREHLVGGRPVERLKIRRAQ